MKKIQELLLESEQLRLETDDAGPQVQYFPYCLKVTVPERYLPVVQNLINPPPPLCCNFDPLTSCSFFRL
jgi:hypothetical protein